MKTTALAGGVLAGLMATLAIGPTATAGQPESHGHHPSRTLAGTTFVVDVAPAETPREPLFRNCYVFEPDGSWVDVFAEDLNGGPLPFEWSESRRGRRLTYEITLPDDVVFQTGRAVPSRRGVLRLRATTPESPFGPLVSRGREVDECPDGVPPGPAS